MPKLTPSPDTLQRARRDIEGHIITVESVIRHMDASNSGLDEIALKHPVLFDVDEGTHHNAMHQITASTTTRVWRTQLAYLKMLARRLRKEEEECRSSFSSSPQPSQLGMQPTSMEDTQTK